MARAARNPRKPPRRLRPPRPLPAALRAALRHVRRSRAGRRWSSACAFAAVAVLGAWLGLIVAGGVRTPVGPMNTSMALRPSLTGGTEVHVAPLGSLQLRSHQAPLSLDVNVDQLNQKRAGALVDHPDRFDGLEREIVADVRAGTSKVLLRSAVAMVTGACALGLVVYRTPKGALAAGGLALALVAVSGLSALATWNPKSVLEPKFSGLLASAPSVVGNARSIVSEFDVYQRELARLVGNMTKLYETTSKLPAYSPDPGTTRVLHVSDIHLNPAAWKIIKSLVKQYDIDVIIDSGDTMDHGTAAENGFVRAAGRLGAPYVWVRGNHDSATTQRAFERLEHEGSGRGGRGGHGDGKSPVRVLDRGRPVDVAGLRIAGWGDPQFTPDRSVVPAGDPEERADGRKLARALQKQRAAHTPVDVAVAHNPVLAQQTDGRVPLTLAGHTHHRSNQTLDHGTRLMIEGSTGGGGLRAVEGSQPQKVAASVLYLDRRTHRLQAWDEVTLGGLGETRAEVTRHLPADLEPGTGPRPTPSPTPSPDASSASPNSSDPSASSGSSGSSGSSSSESANSAGSPGSSGSSGSEGSGSSGAVSGSSALPPGRPPASPSASAPGR